MPRQQTDDTPESRRPAPLRRIVLLLIGLALGAVVGLVVVTSQMPKPPAPPGTGQAGPQSTELPGDPNAAGSATNTDPTGGEDEKPNPPASDNPRDTRITELFPEQTNLAAEIDIFGAMKKQDLPRIDAMIRAHPEVVKFRNPKGATPLHLAAALGDAKICRKLLDSGADVRDKCNLNMLSGQTPLHLAAGQGKVEAMSVLLNYNADVDAVDAVGSTPLHEAALQGRLSAVDLLLDHRAGINARNQNGYTPIFWAVMSGDTKLVEKLRKRGANINAQDSNGYTPLRFAESLDTPAPQKRKMLATIRELGGKE